MLILGAIDPRVKVVVSNVPVIDGYENMWRVHGSERFRKLQDAILEDRRKRFENGQHSYIRCPARRRGRTTASSPGRSTRSRWYSRS